MTIGLGIDIALGILLFLVLIDGYHRGFIKIIGRIAALVVAMMGARYMARTLQKKIGKLLIAPILKELSTGREIADIILEESVEKIAEDVAYAIVFIIVFMLLQVVLFYVISLLGFVNIIPLLGTINRMGGAVASIIWFFMCIFVCSVVVFQILPVEIRQTIGITEGLIRDSICLRLLEEMVSGIQIKM